MGNMRPNWGTQVIKAKNPTTSKNDIRWSLTKSLALLDMERAVFGCLWTKSGLEAWKAAKCWRMGSEEHEIVRYVRKLKTGTSCAGKLTEKLSAPLERKALVLKTSFVRR